MLPEAGTVVLSTRVPVEFAEQVADFGLQTGLSRAAALRVLIERGLNDNLDVDEIRMISFNAKSAALEQLEEGLKDFIREFWSS